MTRMACGVAVLLAGCGDGDGKPGAPSPPQAVAAKDAGVSPPADAALDAPADAATTAGARDAGPREGPAPVEIIAWRANPSPPEVDRVWGKVWVTQGRRRTLNRDDSWRVAQAIERHLLQCKTNSRDDAKEFAAHPLRERVLGWPAQPFSGPRIEVFFRNSPLTATGPNGLVTAWSVLIAPQADGAIVATRDATGAPILFGRCPPCELADSPLRKALPGRVRRTCAAAIATRRRRPRAIEPQHSQMSWAVYVAVADDPADAAMARARQQVAALGYNALTTNVGCENGEERKNGADNDYDVTRGEHMLAVYFANKRDARAFTKLRVPIWWGAVRTYCLD